MQSEYYDTEFGKMHYMKSENFATQKPTIFFLHGGHKEKQNAEFWNPLVDTMKKYCNFVLIDRLGHGKSDKVEVDYETHLKTTKDLMFKIKEEESLPKIGVVGRSAGGKLAIEIAKENDNEVVYLGLIAPAGTGEFKNFLHSWPKSMTILWDIRDPVISFDNISNFKVDKPHVHLLTIGEAENSYASIEPNDIEPTHIPDLEAPDLFDKFLLKLTY